MLGGGIGVSAHGSIRIVTETSKLGMPETSIGFVPDVGGNYLLARAPGEIGAHLALTGSTIGGADAILTGLADHFIASGSIADFITSLATQDPATAVAASATAPPPGVLPAARPWIDAAYAGDDVGAILDRLAARTEDAAHDAHDAIRAKSPTALKAALHAVRRAAKASSLEDVFEQDFRVSLRFLAEPDLAEGIRAQVIDKDRTPHWNPTTLGEVDDNHIRELFAPLGDGELDLERKVRR